MSSASQGPIFVVGSPRTGTTLTQEILSLHPDVKLYNEIHYNERVVDVLGDAEPLSEEVLDRAIAILLDRGQWAFGPDDEAVRERVLGRIRSAGPVTHAAVLEAFLALEAEAHGARVWGDSSPQDILYMDVLKKWYPTAKFVGVVRDPRAFLASYKNYIRKGSVEYRNRFNAVTNSLLWRSYMNSLLRTMNSPLGQDVMMLRYEELVADPEGQVRRMCEFLELEYDPRMLEIQRANSSYVRQDQERTRKGISMQSVERWRTELTTPELWILEKVCAETMRRLGYERVGPRPGLRDLPGLLAAGFQLVPRMYNMLFRNHKPFTWQKVRRVLGDVKER